MLSDDNEVMTAALDADSGLDDENKEMNSQLIAEHEKIVKKVERGQDLTGKDLVLIRDANEIHINDEEDINGRYKHAVTLGRWLKKSMKGVK